MLIRYRFRDSFFRDVDGGAGGGGDPPPPPPASRQTSVADPAHDTGGGGRSNRPTEAELRAEAAAERVGRRTAQEAAEKLRQDVEAARADGDRRVAEATAAHQTRAQKLQATLVNSELRALGAAEGLSDLDLLHLPALDRSKITVDADGNITGAKEAIAAFKAAKPDYFKPPATTTTTTAPPATTTQTTATGAPAPAPAGGSVPGKAVKDMTRDEYAAHMKAMSRRLKNQ